MPLAVTGSARRADAVFIPAYRKSPTGSRAFFVIFRSASQLVEFCIDIVENAVILFVLGHIRRVFLLDLAETALCR